MTLYPSESVLQLNGDACSYDPESYVSCPARGHYLQATECVKTCDDAILPVLLSNGTVECLGVEKNAVGTLGFNGGVAFVAMVLGLWHVAR